MWSSIQANRKAEEQKKRRQAELVAKQLRRQADQSKRLADLMAGRQEQGSKYMESHTEQLSGEYHNHSKMIKHTAESRRREIEQAILKNQEALERVLLRLRDLEIRDKLVSRGTQQSATSTSVLNERKKRLQQKVQHRDKQGTLLYELKRQGSRLSQMNLNITKMMYTATQDTRSLSRYLVIDKLRQWKEFYKTASWRLDPGQSPQLNKKIFDENLAQRDQLVREAKELIEKAISEEDSGKERQAEEERTAAEETSVRFTIPNQPSRQGRQQPKNKGLSMPPPPLEFTSRGYE